MPFTLVLDGDIEKFNFNTFKVEAGPYGLPTACGRGNAFSETEALHDEIERLEAVLKEISELPGDRADEASYMARTAVSNGHRGGEA